MSTTGLILIAKDEEFSLLTTTELLIKEGYECCYSNDAESALKKLNTANLIS